jgi:hypothetical protein
MDTQMTIIRKKNDFEKVWKLVNSTFKINQSLPNQVFNQDFYNFLFEEFDWAMTPEFWNSFIQPLTFASQDTQILVAIVNPDPINYFYRVFGYYNWFNVPINITGDDYWKILETGPKNSPADAMLFNSEIIVWLPLSAKWAIWGERSYGVCILAFSDDNTRIATTTFTKTWKSVDVALNDYIAINFEGKKIPNKIADSLVLNYSKGGQTC